MEPSSNNKNTEWGPLIGTVIIVALLIMGGIYYFVTGQATNSGTQAPAVGAGRA